MPHALDIVASYPRCDRPVTLIHRAGTKRVSACGLPLKWFAHRLDADGHMLGHWQCSKHGSVLSGLEAAQRAGFVMRIEDAA